jgi:hypothetical protein
MRHSSARAAPEAGLLLRARNIKLHRVAGKPPSRFPAASNESGRPVAERFIKDAAYRRLLPERILFYQVAAWEPSRQPMDGGKKPRRKEIL